MCNMLDYFLLFKSFAKSKQLGTDIMRTKGGNGVWGGEVTLWSRVKRFSELIIQI